MNQVMWKIQLSIAYLAPIIQSTGSNPEKKEISRKLKGSICCIGTRETHCFILSSSVFFKSMVPP